MKLIKGKRSSMDLNKWLAVVGVISAPTLGVGFITALVSVALGWRINKEQKVEIATLNKEAKEAGERAANALKDAGVANEAASKANESAAKANERAQKLEGDNIQLRTDLETATAEARNKQTELAREQSNLADEQRKAAEAQRAADEARLALEKHLELVAQNANPRLMSGEQLLKIKRFLEGVYKDPPPITVEVQWNKGTQKLWILLETLMTCS
jgi:hypothetical protein